MSHLPFHSVCTLNLFKVSWFNRRIFFKLNSSRADSQLGRQERKSDRLSFSSVTRDTPYSFAESYTVADERDVTDNNESRLKHFGNPCCHALGGAADVAVVSRHKLLAFFCL